ncbi:MAG TPA: hypothetical protein DIC64_04105 [Alphaproteobacteria bacterium]|nr:hypothetical protein [Alphaproteobacteria bacterium]
MRRSLYLAVLLMCSATTVQAEPVAGELTTKPSRTPYVAIEPKQNITDILHLSSSKSTEEPDVYFDADELITNQKEKTIEALGNVVVRREGLTLYTDKLVYNQQQDTIFAIGNVVLSEPEGIKIYSDKVNLTGKLTQAEMKQIKVIMRDESKLWAEYFKKKENDNKVMRYVTFTPCDCCEENGGKAPLWRIRARKVTHDAANKNMNYNDAFLDFKNVPVLYSPFLSHPDPTVKRRSGFMPPKIKSSSYLGGAAQINYFWDISEHSDILFSPTFSTDKGVLLGGRYRSYFKKGYLEAEGTYLNDDDPNRPNNRGNLFAFGRYEINDLWVASTHLNYASDSLYLKELSLPKDNEAWLTSDVSFERFNFRDYASIQAYYYKLISYDLKEKDSARYDRLKYNKPFVLPLIESEFVSDPNSIGAYYKNDLSFASLYHSNGQQSQRATMINSWNLPWTSRFGERYKIVASVKTDAYHVEEYQYRLNKKDYNGNPVRVFPQLGVEWKLPFVKASDTSRQILEPVIVGVLAPNGGNKSEKIPNEDSQDAHFEDTNVLDLNRYAGYDRNDNGSRISYGFNWNTYGNIMGRTSAFFAQSYQFNKNTSFAKNTGSKGHLSDYVGRIYAAPADYLNLTYRFRLDRNDYKLRYNELATRFGTNMLNLYVSYIYLQKNKYASETLSERKELYTAVSAALTRDWSINVYNRQDLSHGGGSLEHGGNLIYEDECFMFVTNVKKYNSSDPDLDDSYEFTFSFYLKTLGGLGS